MIGRYGSSRSAFAYFRFVDWSAVVVVVVAVVVGWSGLVRAERARPRPSVESSSTRAESFPLDGSMASQKRRDATARQ